MGKKNHLNIVLFTLSILTVCFLHTNAYAEINIAGIKLIPSVNIDYSFDDNYRFLEKKEESAYSVNVSPSIKLKYDEGIADFDFNARSPYRHFSESTTKKSKYLETYYEAVLKIKLPMEIRIQLEDDFVSSKLSPFLTEERFNRTDRTENHFRGSLIFPVGTLTGFNVDYRNDNYRYVDKGSTFFPFSLNNRKSDNISFRTYFSVLKDTRLFVRYSYRRLIYKNDNVKQYYQSSRGFQANQTDYGIEQVFGSIFRVAGSIGKGKIKNALTPASKNRNRDDRNQDDRLTWNSSLFINAGPKLDIFFNVSKSVATKSFELSSEDETEAKGLSMFLSLKSQLTSDTELSIIGGKTSTVSQSTERTFKNVTVNIEQKYFSRITSTLEFEYGINDFKGGYYFSSGNNREDKRWSGEERINFKINSNMTIGIRYLHQERKSFFGDFKRNVISFTTNLTY